MKPKHSKPSAAAWDEAMARVPAFAARVHPIYVALQWKWVDDSGRLSVPTLKQIRSSLQDKLTRLRKRVEDASDRCRYWLGVWTGGGGLRVTCGLDMMGEVVITLAFFIECEIDGRV